MIAFKISVNDQLVLTASADDMALLSAQVNAMIWPAEEPPAIIVSGARRPPNNSTKSPVQLPSIVWDSIPLNYGDEIRIRIVDVDQYDPPSQEASEQIVGEFNYMKDKST